MIREGDLWPWPREVEVVRPALSGAGRKVSHRLGRRKFLNIDRLSMVTPDEPVLPKIARPAIS